MVHTVDFAMCVYYFIMYVRLDSYTVNLIMYAPIIATTHWIPLPHNEKNLNDLCAVVDSDDQFQPIPDKVMGKHSCLLPAEEIFGVLLIHSTCSIYVQLDAPGSEVDKETVWY